jgi:alpha-glucuronidase
MRKPCIPLYLVLLSFAGDAAAETGRDAWLRYARLDEPALSHARAAIPAVVVVAGQSPLLTSARDELIRGVRGMIGRTLRIETAVPKEPAIFLGTAEEIQKLAPQIKLDGVDDDGFRLRTVAGNVTVSSTTDRGVLYGTFALLRKIAIGDPLASIDEKQIPYSSIRWINQWDNLDGSIERGYGGRSIFWENGHVRENLERAGEYGRLLASLGINATTINNVNANPKVLSPDILPQVARIAAAFRPWGIRVALSVDFGSPKSVGGLDTFDPLDPTVAKWWKDTADAIYAQIPDFAGFVLKADSEGRVGPSTYGRSHADAANVVARGLAPHNGILLYRGFVYDHHMDWNNPKNDRARAAYDNFKPLDGKFDANVIIQIKNGPIDFQVREPASPLLGALENTNEAIELQVTQEYMGQARHMVFLVPQWKEGLDFDMHAGAAATPVKAIAAGKVFHRPYGGFVGVTNVGLDENWLGNHLSMANLYGFGRLAWNPDLTSRSIADEWTRQTFGSDPKVFETIAGMQLRSWRAYENYTGPLGLQTLTNIVGDHYGVAVEASERNGWGQWHRADEKGVGMDRTVATGTGYIGQYSSVIAKMYESLATCPDDLLLFFHHVPYTYVLHDGKTVIQYLYDAHYEGYASVEAFVHDWKTLKGHVDDQRYEAILDQLVYQLGQAEVWRDAVNDWFRKESGIADAKGRVGNHPGRVEAEDMQLEKYTIFDVLPWEAASGGKAIVCKTTSCTVETEFKGDAGWHTIRVRYFDMPAGIARFKLLVNDQTVAQWAAADHAPARHMDASASALRIVDGIALRPGDIIRIEGSPDGDDPAGLDYIDIR